jgi:hypothetical protein
MGVSSFSQPKIDPTGPVAKPSPKGAPSTFKDKDGARNPAFVSSSATSSKKDVVQSEPSQTGEAKQQKKRTSSSAAPKTKLQEPDSAPEDLSFQYIKDESTGKYVKGPLVGGGASANKSTADSSPNPRIRLKTASKAEETSTSTSLLNQGPVAPLPDRTPKEDDGQGPRRFEPDKERILDKKKEADEAQTGSLKPFEQIDEVETTPHWFEETQGPGKKTGTSPANVADDSSLKPVTKWFDQR